LELLSDDDDAVFFHANLLLYDDDVRNVTKQSYAKLLSPSAVNLGLRATPADYPSLCTHSMIGDQIFDVIILEFSPNRGQHRDFDRLAKRLRARFPYAIIIHLPIFMLLNDVDYRGRSLQEHLISSGVQSPKESAFFDTIRSANELDLTYPALANQLDWYKETLASIGGYMIEFPTYQIDVKNLVIENAKYYGNRHSPWDFVHPNELGHEFIAHKIRQKVARIFAEEPRDHGATRDWSGKDQCLSWFLNGNVTGDIQNMHQMSLHQFNPEGDGKWALDVNPIGGSFTVECTFPKCSIYISHMAMGPHRQYPRALVSLNDQEPKLVDPLLYNYHLTQIVHVGTMEKPGIATVHVKPIPEDVDSALPFRITGVIRTPTV
jgi:hypothetical protein